MGDFKKDIGYRIRGARMSLGLSQLNLAVRSDITVGRIASWETGKTIPGLQNLIRLCRALNVSADYLLGLGDKSGLTKT